MAETATNFPPQTYSSSFFLNALTDDEKSTTTANKDDANKRTNTTLLDCFLSTMLSNNMTLIVLIVLILPIYEALQCSNEPKIRIFESLHKYQSNHLPFICTDSLYEGNSIEFQSPVINSLSKNSFITYQSQYIIKIDLSRKHIENIDDGAFISLDCVQELLLNSNNLTTITESTFLGLNNLEILNLNDNNLTKISDYTFAIMYRLKMLDLSENQIEILDESSFYNLTNLEELNLKFNNLKLLPSNVLQPLINLNNLHLAGNNLKSFDGFVCKNLKFLNLSTNQLEQLNANDIHKNLPKLISIDLNNNLWYCVDLVVIIRQLVERNIRIISGNSNVNNYRGIACSNTSKISTGTINDTLATTVKAFINNINNSGIDSKNSTDNRRNDLEINAHVFGTVQYIQVLCILTFILFVLFLVYEFFIKYNSCGRFNLYDNNVEYLHLLNTNKLDVL